MLTPCVVGSFPFGVDDRPLSYFNDAVAWAKADTIGCVDQINMGPLIAMAVDLVTDLAEENPLRRQNAVGFSQERRIRVREIVPVFLRRSKDQTEADVEIL